MLSKTFSAAAVAFLASAVSAQTFTDCDPTKTDCRADPAFGSRKAECNYLEGKCDIFQELPGTTLSYGDKGAIFSIEKETNAPTIESSRYMFFGRLEVECIAANGQGIITSIVLESDDLDEIDLEWTGGDNHNVQSNYFSKGDTTTYDRGGTHAVGNPLTEFNTYVIDWTPTSLKWIVNGATVRELKYSDAKGGSTYPQSPMQVKLGTWVAGRQGAPKGTVEWAGGYTDFNKAPFNAYYKSIKIVDYAGTDKPATGDIKEYVYGDRSGTWKSIKVVKGDGSSDDEEKETSTTSSAKATKTKTVEHTKTKTPVTETETEAEVETKTKTSTVTTATTLATKTTAAAETTIEAVVPVETSDKPETVPGNSAGAKAVSLVAVVGVVAAQLLF